MNFFKIHTNKDELEGTGYFEIGSGKYPQTHWNEGFIFINEYGFEFAEGIIKRHYPEFDHYSMDNDVPSTIAGKIEDEWREASNKLYGKSVEEMINILGLEKTIRDSMKQDWIDESELITTMLRELSDWMKQFRQNQDWVCILGI